MPYKHVLPGSSNRIEMPILGGSTRGNAQGGDDGLLSRTKRLGVSMGITSETLPLVCGKRAGLKRDTIVRYGKGRVVPRLYRRNGSKGGRSLPGPEKDNS
jgi:hypothetical protein